MSDLTFYGLIALGVVVIGLVVWLKPSWAGVTGKTAWDWIALFLVPTTVGFATFLISVSQSRLEADRQYEVAVQQYFDRISTLAIEQNDANYASTLAVARAHTSAIFSMVSGERAGRVLVFLSELNWLGDLVDDLENLDFSGSELKSFDLSGIEFEEANFSNADLEYSNFVGSEFEDANLYNADLDGADLRDADFEGANLNGAQLRGADLRGADLTMARNVTDKMLADSCMDATTKLPSGLTPVTARREACDASRSWDSGD